MRVFSGERVGGFGLEKQLDEAADVKGVDEAAAAKIAALGTKTAIIGIIAGSYGPRVQTRGAQDQRRGRCSPRR